MTLQQLFPNLDLSRITDAGYLSQFAHPDQGVGGYQLRGSDGELYDLNSTLSNEEGGLGQMLGLQNGSINVTHHYGTGDTGGGQYYEFGRDGTQLASRDYKNYAHNVRDAVGMSAMVLAPILGGAMLGAGAGAGSGTAEAGMSVGNGAFLGEGAASGVGAWDGALTGAQAGSAAAGTGAMGASSGGGAAGTGEGVSGAGGFVGEGAPSGVPAWDGASGANIGGWGPGGSSLSAKAGTSLGGFGSGGGSSDGLAGAALKYGAPLLGSAISANAAGKAANTQAAATDRANALLQGNLDRTRNDLAPWRDSGVKANNALVSAMGLGPNDGSAGYGSLTKQFTGADLQNEPGYQFGLTQGQRALDAKAAAGGGYFSGNALKAAARYNDDYAGTKYGEAFARDQSTKGQQYGFLSGMSTQGQNAANMTGQFGSATTGAIAGNTTALGNAQGAAQIAQGNALSNGLGSVSNAYNQDNMLQQILANQRQQQLLTGGNTNGLR